METTKREQIIKIAVKLFSKRGYAATSMRDIAKEVGMEPASLYNHIKSKQDILRHSILDIASLYTSSIQNVLNMKISPLAKLEQLISDQISITIEHTEAVSLIPSEWVHLEGAKAEFIKVRNEYENGFKQLLTEAVEAKEIRSVDIELTTFSVLSTLRYLYSWYSRNKEIDPAILKVELKKNLLEGVGRR